MIIQLLPLFADEKQKAFFVTIEGKLFYHESFNTPYSGIKRQIELVKPISCQDFSQYNSCNILSIKISFGDNLKVFSFSVTKDTHRVDSFIQNDRKENFKLLTQEQFDEAIKLASDEMEKAFSLFNL